MKYIFIDTLIKNLIRWIGGWKMSEISLETYKNILEEQISDNEILEDYIYKVSYQKSQYRWYGIERVRLEKSMLDDDSEIYVIQEESATELIKLNSNYPNERFREKLLDAAASHDLGDITTVAVFD